MEKDAENQEKKEELKLGIKFISIPFVSIGLFSLIGWFIDLYITYTIGYVPDILIPFIFIIAGVITFFTIRKIYNIKRVKKEDKSRKIDNGRQETNFNRFFNTFFRIR